MAKIRSIVLPRIGIFWVNWLILLWSKYVIPLSDNISKILSLPNCTKIRFLGKLTNVTIVYLLCPIMLKCFKKNLYDRSWYKVEYIWAKLGQNWALIVLLPEKEIFWEDWLILLSTYPLSLCYNVSKFNPYSSADHET